MFSPIPPKNQELPTPYITVIGAGVGKRVPDPQDIPFADLLSYGANGSPTITMTKTLYSAGEVTSTTSDSSASTNASANGKQEDGTSTMTGTSTVYNTITITSTSISTTTVHDNSPLISLPSAHSNLTSSAASSASARIPLGTASVNSTQDATPPSLHRQQGGTIAGATLGSMAAFGMIGFLVWWCCAKKRGKRKLKIKFNIERRKSSTAKTRQLEDQSMEETRRMMLERSKDLNEFLRSPPVQSNYSSAPELPGDVGVKRHVSQAESPRQHPSWIGIAVTSSTPPNTPPLPRSNSQRSTRTMQSTVPSAGYPNSLMPGFGSQHVPTALMPTPLKPAMKPAPIITNHSLARPEQVSPLSPRGMFNAVSNTASRTWRRASQALSPGAYQRVADDGGQSGTATPKRRDSKPRNPALEIGHQTDKNWEGQWI